MGDGGRRGGGHLLRSDLLPASVKLLAFLFSLLRIRKRGGDSYQHADASLASKPPIPRPPLLPSLDQGLARYFESSQVRSVSSPPLFTHSPSTQKPQPYSHPLPIPA
jgi:hypothetical protein